MTAGTSKIWLILFVPTYIVYIYAWKSGLHALHKGLYRLDVLIFQSWADCEQSFIYCFWLLIRQLSVSEVPQSDQVENIERALWKIHLVKPQTITKVRAGQEASYVGRWARCRYIMVVQMPLLLSWLSLFLFLLYRRYVSYRLFHIFRLILWTRGNTLLVPAIRADD